MAAGQIQGSAGATPAAAELGCISASPQWMGVSSSPADTAEQWEAVADSKAASENSWGARDLHQPLWHLGECAHSGSCSPPHAREVFVFVTYQRCCHTAHMCLSAQAEPQNPVAQPQDTHKGTGGKRTHDLNRNHKYIGLFSTGTLCH